MYLKNIMNVKIVGDGVFGRFLTCELSPFCNIVDDADIVILAVPFDAYEQVASNHANKHLINVCSIQQPTNDICLAYSDRVTGIHPLFGPNSGVFDRTCLLTLETVDSEPIIKLFGYICSNILREFNEKPLTGEIHDVIMSITHKPMIELRETISEIIKTADKIPDEYVPTSFKTLRSFYEQFGDVSDGTKDSILANRY